MRIINRAKVKSHFGGVFWPASHRGGLVSFAICTFFFFAITGWWFNHTLIISYSNSSLSIIMGGKSILTGSARFNFSVLPYKTAAKVVQTMHGSNALAFIKLTHLEQTSSKPNLFHHPHSCQPSRVLPENGPRAACSTKWDKHPRSSVRSYLTLNPRHEATTTYTEDFEVLKAAQSGCAYRWASMATVPVAKQRVRRIAAVA